MEEQTSLLDQRPKPPQKLFWRTFDETETDYIEEAEDLLHDSLTRAA